MNTISTILLLVALTSTNGSVPDAAMRAVGDRVAVDEEVGTGFWYYLMSIEDLRSYLESDSAEPFEFASERLVGAPVRMADGQTRGVVVSDTRGSWAFLQGTGGASSFYARIHALQSQGYEVTVVKEPINGQYIFARDSDGTLFVAPTMGYEANNLGMKRDESGDYALAPLADVVGQLKSTLSGRIGWDQLSPVR